MKFIIEHYQAGGFFISHNHKLYGDCDHHMAEILGIAYEEYSQILENCGAKKNGWTKEYRFENIKDAEQCVKFLEPYLIMINLTEE